MNGLNIAGADVVGPQVPNEWTISGTGDFNADGRGDILWRNDNGQASVWLMNGLNVASADVVGPQVPNEWMLT